MEKRKPIGEKCKLCGDGVLQYMFTANQCILAKCCECEFVQVINQDKIPQYQYSTSYFVNSKYMDKSTQLKEYFRRSRMIAKYLPKGRILDYGCATGEFVRYMSGLYEVDGCDISKDAIMMAKKRYHFQERHFYHIEQLADIGKKYDAICLWDVIEHISDPCEIIFKVKSMIDDDGYIFISTPNIGAAFSRFLKSKWPFMTPPEHLSFFSHKSIDRLAKAANMEIVEWETKGKWVNIAFALYKFNRVSSIKIPDKIIKVFQTTFLSKWKVYVPTGDIQYVVLKNV